MQDSAAERLMTTASRLFQDRGLARVGINEIIRDAEVARMSLYNHFRSKEDLACAVYARLSESRRAAMDAAIESAADPGAAILSLFDLAATLAAKERFRGCAFINLAAHIGADDERLLTLVRQHKTAVRDRFEVLASRCGASAPSVLARQLLALWDGALVDAHIERSLDPIRAARAAAQHLLPAPA